MPSECYQSTFRKKGARIKKIMILALLSRTRFSLSHIEDISFLYNLSTQVLTNHIEPTTVDT